MLNLADVHLGHIAAQVTSEVTDRGHKQSES